MRCKTGLLRRMVVLFVTTTTLLLTLLPGQIFSVELSPFYTAGFGEVTDTCV